MTKPIILIVDDEKSARDGLVRALRRDYRVLAAENAALALEVLSSQQVDVLLSDVRMPGMDGLECAGHLNRLTPPPAIIFSTAYDAYACQAFDLNAVDYLLKRYGSGPLWQPSGCDVGLFHLGGASRAAIWEMNANDKPLDHHRPHPPRHHGTS